MRRLTEDEHDRRRQALERFDTITEAAEHLGMNYKTLRSWGMRYFDAYEEKFGYDGAGTIGKDEEDEEENRFL